MSREVALRRQLDAFVDSVARSAPPVVSGEDGRRALALAFRILDGMHGKHEGARESAG